MLVVSDDVLVPPFVVTTAAWLPELSVPPPPLTSSFTATVRLTVELDAFACVSTLPLKSLSSPFTVATAVDKRSSWPLRIGAGVGTVVLVVAIGGASRRGGVVGAMRVRLGRAAVLVVVATAVAAGRVGFAVGAAGLGVARAAAAVVVAVHRAVGCRFCARRTFRIRFLPLALDRSGQPGLAHNVQSTWDVRA